MKNVHLLIIDPQNDFCDFQKIDGNTYTPALPVTGAIQDMQNIAHLIESTRSKISDITVTLDSHHYVGIERPTYWMNSEGGDVAPFTTILLDDVISGRYLPRDPGRLDVTKQYLQSLEAAGKYHLMIWPVHCQIGSWGACVHEKVMNAYNAWEMDRQKFVSKVTKGSNPFTEHYSPFMAEVPTEDPLTHMNQNLLRSLSSADCILVAGEASSHCVKAGVEHLSQKIYHGDKSRIVLLTDCMSPVAGFEQSNAGFFNGMRADGLQLMTHLEAIQYIR